MAACGASAGSGSAACPVRYWPVMLSGLTHDLVGGALGDEVAAMHAGARPHIDQPVGGADRLLVVLDDDDRVAEVAQPLQRRRAAARCRAGAARSTARRARRARRSAPSRSARRAGCAGSRRPTACPRRAIRVRYSSPTFFRKPSRSLISFRMRAAISLWLGVSVASTPANQSPASSDRQRRRLADVLAGDLDRQRLGLEPVAVAHLAGLGALVAAELLAHPGAVGLAEAPLHVRQHALERPVGRVLPQAVVIGHLDRLAARAVEDRLAASFPAGRATACACSA